MKFTIVCKYAKQRILLKFNKKNCSRRMKTVDVAVESFLPMTWFNVSATIGVYFSFKYTYSPTRLASVHVVRFELHRNRYEKQFLASLVFFMPWKIGMYMGIVHVKYDEGDREKISQIENENCSTRPITYRKHRKLPSFVWKWKGKSAQEILKNKRTRANESEAERRRDKWKEND